MQLLSYSTISFAHGLLQSKFPLPANRNLGWNRISHLVSDLVWLATPAFSPPYIHHDGYWNDEGTADMIQKPAGIWYQRPALQKKLLIT